MTTTRARVLAAIRAGNEESGAIANAASIPRTNVNHYLAQLWKAGLIERQRVTEERPISFIRYSAPMDP